MSRKPMTSKYERALRTAETQSSPTKAVYDLLLSADKEGDFRATYALATWYLFGTKFTKKDINRANKMLEAAALHGVSAAAYDFAVSLEKGIGVRKSERHAFEFYTRAALLGDQQSSFEVGRMLYHGIGTPRNRRLAKIWLDRAEKSGASR
jgi:TPR repeat protein